MVTDTKISFRLSWLRSQVVALTATGVDFFLTIFLTEVTGLWYVASNAAGAFSGAVVSFVLCRNWAFNRRNSRWHFQALRYACTSGASMLLNTAGVWFVTEALVVPYVVSKIIVATLVGISFNFLMFRYFVFR